MFIPADLQTLTKPVAISIVDNYSTCAGFSTGIPGCE
jgi:hypothetical protein